MTRTMVVWKWEEEESDGEGVGPVWSDSWGADPDKPEKSVKWDRCFRRSEAERYAQVHGLEFFADE